MIDSEDVSLKDFNRGLINFLNSSPTPYHAAANIEDILIRAGFQKLDETAEWDKPLSGRYYCVRDGSAIAAFNLPENYNGKGLKIIAAHTDSPSLKLRPCFVVEKMKYGMLSVEVYGSPVLSTWIDRSLGIAGRITYSDADYTIGSILVDSESPVAVIPGLAVHLERDSVAKKEINLQKDINPLVFDAVSSPEWGERELYNFLMSPFDISPDACTGLSNDLYLYDTEPALITGINSSLINGPRIDNLAGCYVAAMSLAGADPALPVMSLFTDHEEVGSVSLKGADGDFPYSIIRRIFDDYENYASSIRDALLISIDSAHAVHPAFPDVHDTGHSPVLNGGPVIKYNSRIKYISSDVTRLMFQSACSRAGVPVQYFSARNDIPCGSTVGPIISSALGIRGIDIGIPSLSMHSIRETTGVMDTYWLLKGIDSMISQY